MSDDLGMVEYGDGGAGGNFLGRDMPGNKNYSEDTAQKIDNEIKAFIDNAYKLAEKLLNENREILDKISLALLEYETLDARHIKDIMEHGEMKDPPKPPEPPELPDDAKKEEASEKPSEERSRGDNGTMPPEIVGAPA
jgi:cell division protease FtsH